MIGKKVKPLFFVWERLPENLSIAVGRIFFQVLVPVLFLLDDLRMLEKGETVSGLRGKAPKTVPVPTSVSGKTAFVGPLQTTGG